MQILPATPIKCIQLYYQKEIVLLFMDDSVCATSGSYKRQHLQLPVDICNVCIRSNESQIRSLFVSTSGTNFLVAVYNKVLLFYDLDKGSLTRSVEAHSARINQILCLDSIRSAKDAKGSASTTLASASMDKSVKLWNLNNISKDSHDIESSGQAIEHLCISNHKETVAACLESNELLIWDWSEGVIIHRLDIDQMLSMDSDSTQASQKDQTRDRFVRCCFSSTGKSLVVVSLHFIVIFNVKLDANHTGTGRISARLQLMQKKRLVDGSLSSYLARKIWFLNHDSRVLVALEDNCDRSVCEFDDDLHQYTRYLSLICYNTTDLMQVYRITNHSPSMRPREESHLFETENLAGVQQAAYGIGANLNYRLPIVTLDQLNIVTAEFATSFRSQAETLQDTSSATSRRRPSSVSQAPVTLNVYATRDGTLLRFIELSQLNPRDLLDAPKGNQQVGSKYLPEIARPGSHSAPKLVNITNNQFTRMKSAKFQESSTAIGLVDDRGFSFLIDIQSGQMISSSRLWSGKLSSDGRYGLSRVFKSASSFSTGKNALNASASAVSTDLVSRDLGGLHLIEMRRFKSMKVVLTTAELSKLLVDTQAVGSEAHLKYGFTKQNDSYVYLYDSRVRHLLLIRLRDSSLIANYKLPLGVTKIRCSPDGYTLILAHTNGSLTCLAIVDPQTSDTLTRLSQHPSRRLWKDAKQ